MIFFKGVTLDTLTWLQWIDAYEEQLRTLDSTGIEIYDRVYKIRQAMV